MATLERSGTGGLGLAPALPVRGGSGVLTLTGSGSQNRGTVITRSGMAAVGAVASSRSGSATSAWTGSGSRTLVAGGTITRSGMAILGQVGIVRSGLAVRAMVAQGNRNLNGNVQLRSGTSIIGRLAINRSGLGVLTFVGIQSSNLNVITRSHVPAGGTGTPSGGLASITRAVGWKASGSRMLLPGGAYVLGGTAVSAMVAQGSRTIEHVRGGMAVTALVGRGSKSLTLTRGGTAVTALTGRSSRSLTISRGGLAISARVAQGSFVFGLITRTGTAGVLTFGGSATRGRDILRGGTAVSARSGSGSFGRDILRRGTAESAWSVTGARAMVIVKGGTAVSTYVGYGQRETTQPVIQRSAIAVSAMVASGSRALTTARTGNTAQVSFAAAGTRVAGTIHARGGTATSTLAASGSAFQFHLHVKSAMPRYTWLGDATRTLREPAAYERSGTAIIDFDAFAKVPRFVRRQGLVSLEFVARGRRGFPIPDMTFMVIHLAGTTSIRGRPAARLIRVKQDDISQPLVGYIADSRTGARLNLSGCELLFLMRPKVGVDAAPLARDASVTDPVNGAFAYEWREGDNAVAGHYRAELVAEFPGGQDVTLPRDGYIDVQVIPNAR